MYWPFEPLSPLKYIFFNTLIKFSVGSLFNNLLSDCETSYPAGLMKRAFEFENILVSACTNVIGW